MNSRVFLSLTIACVSFALIGCANLQIKVYTYIGDETYGGDVQLAEAIGEASSARQTALEMYARLTTDTRNYSTEWTYLAPDLKDLADAYEHEDHIDSLQKELDASRSDATAYSAARKQMAVALIQFSQRCIAMGQRLGIPEQNDLFWLLKEGGRQLIISGVGLENAGLKVQRLAANVRDDNRFTPIASIFKSVRDGVVQGKLEPQAPEYSALLETSNWQLENVQSFGGSGDMNDVVVKDEVGNWVQKSFTNDPTGVIGATFDGSTLVVDTLAAAYGVPLPKTTGNTSASDDTEASPADSGIAQKEVHAQNVTAQIKTLKSELADNLQDLSKQNTDDATRKKIVATIQLYKARLDALAAIDNSTPSTPPAK